MGWQASVRSDCDISTRVKKKDGRHLPVSCLSSHVTGCYVDKQSAGLKQRYLAVETCQLLFHPVYVRLIQVAQSETGITEPSSLTSPIHHPVSGRICIIALVSRRGQYRGGQYCFTPRAQGDNFREVVSSLFGSNLRGTDFGNRRWR